MGSERIRHLVGACLESAGAAGVALAAGIRPAHIRMCPELFPADRWARLQGLLGHRAPTGRGMERPRQSG